MISLEASILEVDRSFPHNVLDTDGWKKIYYKPVGSRLVDTLRDSAATQHCPYDTIMRTQTPTSPLDVVGVDVARYGPPQHEQSTGRADCLYGPPQHEQCVEHPDWLVSIACRALAAGPVQSVPVPTPPESEPNSTADREREPAVIRQ